MDGDGAGGRGAASGSPISSRGSTRCRRGAASAADRERLRRRRERRFRQHIAARPEHAPPALGVMFDLVRALNSAIDAGELGSGDAAQIARGVRRVRSGARRPVAAPRRGCAAAGAGRGDRAAHRSSARAARAARTSPKPTIRKDLTLAASCSRTRPPDTRWKTEISGAVNPNSHGRP